MTSASLVEATEDPTVLIPEGISDLPTYLEVVRIVDMAARFKGAKTFVEDSSKGFPLFYQDVGQHLSKWIAKAPKVKEPEAVSSSIPNILSNSEGEVSIDIPMSEGEAAESNTSANESATQ